MKDLELIVEQVPAPWGRLFSLLRYTGARYSEVANLTRECLRPAPSGGRDVFIDIKPHTLPDGTLWRPKRPASVRSLRVPGALALAYLEGPDPGALIFWPGRPRPVSVRQANRELERVCTRLGLRQVRTHDFRRARIAQALAAGADPNTVRAAVGHRSLATTVGYLRDVPVQGALPPLDAEAVDNPVAAQYVPLYRKKTWA